MSSSSIQHEAAVKAQPRPGRLRLWLDLLGAPVLWSIQLLTMYALVPYVCNHGKTWLFYVVTIAFLLAAALVGFLAWRSWVRSGQELESMDEGDALSRSRFMAIVGLLSSVLFGMLILWQGIPALIIDPCVQ